MSDPGDLVRLECAEGIATVTLNRPEALNALTVPMKEQLLRVLRGLERDGTVRVVVLTGAGRAFCAGQDLRERQAPEAVPLEIELRERYNPIVRALRDLSRPVIAAVNGVAAGAGASLAFACDLRIAASSASFVLAFGRIGLVPDSGATWLLPRLVGSARAAEIALLGEPLSAREAERIGLVSRVVADDMLAGEAGAVASGLAAMAPRALALTKRALQRAQEATFAEALEYEAAVQGIAGRTRDHAEGVAAFVEKRSPRFTGE